MTAEEQIIDANEALDYQHDDAIECAPEFVRFAIDTEERANWYLRHLANKEAEKARVKAQAETILKTLDADITRFRARFEGELIDFVREQLSRRGDKRKTLPLLQGTCAFRTQPASVRVANAADAIAYAKEQGWDVVRTQETLDGEGYRRQALAELMETGNVLPGIEPVPERESFSIKFGGKEGAAE